MYLHIEFKDGSNPYLFYPKNVAKERQRSDIGRELKRWSKHYNLTLIREAKDRFDGYFYLAEEK